MLLSYSPHLISCTLKNSLDIIIFFQTETHDKDRKTETDDEFFFNTFFFKKERVHHDEFIFLLALRGSHRQIHRD